MLQQQINRMGQRHIDNLKAVCCQLWEKACKADGIPSDSKFVVFSEGNKFVPFLDKARQQVTEAEAQYRAGGYVGLTLKR